MNGRSKKTIHRSKHTINFYSYKNNCHVWCESFLEQDYALSLEFDEHVKNYATQPEFFSVYGRRYTPDFLVEYTSGYAEYVEVKHTAFMDEEFFNKHDLRKEVIFTFNGLNLMLISELELSPVAVHNYELLASYKQLNVTDLLPMLQNLPKVLTFTRLEKFISKIKGYTRAHAWALVAHEFFHFNLTEPLDSHTKLMRA